MEIRVKSRVIYKVKSGNGNINVLMIYSISKRLHVGVPIYDKQNKNETYVYLEKLKKFADIEHITEYHQNIYAQSYENGKLLKIENKDFNKLLSEIKKYYLSLINKKINPKVEENIRYLKWCLDQFTINEKEFELDKIKNMLKFGNIFWIDYGYNVGSELRKIRPAIIWRTTKEQHMTIVIPLSSSCYKDKCLYHYDIQGKEKSTALIESMRYISTRRIREPYYYNNKIMHITEEDKKSIIDIIKYYYCFEDLNK